MKISRQAYAEMFGPTLGDRVRLADTELWIEVEKDFTVYGEEVKFGGGKVIRDGMGKASSARRRSPIPVITIALIANHWGSSGRHRHQEGRIWKIGKAGNPDIQQQVNIPIGAVTEATPASIIVLPAASMRIFISSVRISRSKSADVSVTTMLGGGTGPATAPRGDLHAGSVAYRVDDRAAEAFR